MKANDTLNKIYTALLAFKKVLSMEEACDFTGLSKSRLYQATREKEVRFFKNFGKVYFKREDLESWMLKFEIQSEENLEIEAMNDNL